jgi:hypothetical protein
VPFVVYAGNLIVIGAIFGPTRGRAGFIVQRKALVGLRAVCLAASSLFAALAFQRMPVAGRCCRRARSGPEAHLAFAACAGMDSQEPGTASPTNPIVTFLPMPCAPLIAS